MKNLIPEWMTLASDKINYQHISTGGKHIDKARPLLLKTKSKKQKKANTGYK